MTDSNFEASSAAPPGADPDASTATEAAEPFVEIVDIAVAPVPSSPPPAAAEVAQDDGGGAPSAAADADDDPEPTDPLAPLSPAVRRLVRQYDLDVTGVHGTGPGGRLRVGDVIGMLGGRGETAGRPTEPRAAEPFAGERAEERGDSDDAPAAGAERTAAPAPAAAPVCTVFECDLGRVLAHRKRERQSEVDLLLTSYYLAACREALHAVPEVAPASGPLPARLGVLLAGPDGDVRTLLVDADDPPLALDDRVRAFDRALRTGSKAVLDTADFVIDNYGGSGSVLMTPMPLGPGGAASIGIGRARRGLVDGEDAPRVGAVCYVTLTFLPDRIAPHRANRFVAEVVRVLEHWPG